MRGTGAELGARLRARDLAAAPAAHVVGVTGPPGAGKSTLLGELVRTWRAAGRTVAALAVDPSSRRSGGALLGARRSLGGRHTAVVAFSSLPPAQGVDDLVAALDAHRARLDIAARRL